MSASTTLRRREDSPARWQSFLNHDVIAIVVAAMLALVATRWLVAEPNHVALTIVNETAYEVSVAATSPDAASRAASGWTPVVVIDPGQRRTDRITIDQGDEWVFRFEGQGRSGGEITLTRRQLADDDWHLVIPSSVVDQLESQGAEPPPRSR